MGKYLESFKREKEEVIFESALKVIKEKGFHKARMSDIAREARISYGLVYHYFRNKEDLFEAILKRWWEGLFRLMSELKGSQCDVPRKLRHIITYFFDTYQHHPEMVTIFITEISRSTSNLTHSRLENIKKFMALTDAVIEEGQKKRMLRTDFKARYLTYIFLGALETFVTAMVFVDQKIRGDDQKKRIVESILDVFLNGAKNQKQG
ncbi:MAG: TetR/AcrR family transcriptional regulator [Pseudomonadota bacterium]